MLLTNLKANRIKFSIDKEETLRETTVCVIAVGTPEKADGNADLQYVYSVAKDIGKTISKHTYIIDKSTVPVGTAENVKNIVAEELKKRDCNVTFDVISNPEFLKEGVAINDCMRPERIIVGVDNSNCEELMRNLYAPFVRNSDRFIVMDVRSAEMTKYVANAMLATKISFMNEMANISEKVGADINKVRLGIGSDPRIGYSFIYPGCGYGGSCFPKDVKALIGMGLEHGYDTEILKAVDYVNKAQKLKLVEMIVDKYGTDLSKYRFAVWGLAFKPETDDLREASSVVIIKELLLMGATIVAYDPKAMAKAKELFGTIEGITFVDDKYSALENSDAMILITEWKEFKSPDFDKIKECLRTSVIFDGRNQYSARELAETNIEYHQIGVKHA